MLSQDTKAKVDKVVSELCDHIFVEINGDRGYVVSHVKLLTDLIQAVALLSGKPPIVNITTTGKTDCDEIISKIQSLMRDEITNSSNNVGN